MNELQVINPIGPILPKGEDLEAVIGAIMENRGGLLDRIQLRMEQCPQEQQLSIPDMTSHFFQPDLGLYARRMEAPAGAIIVTKIHLSEHPFIVTKGRFLVMNEANGEEAELVAPCVGITKPGTRRLFIILEDTEWITIHPTKSTDLDEIEREIILDYTPKLKEIEQ